MVSDGLMTIEQPAASAGITFHIPIISGKFQGTIPATTPTGSFTRPRLIAGALRQRNGKVEGLTRNFGGQPGGIAHPVQGAADFKHAGNIDGFALFQRFKLGQLLAVLLDQIGEMKQDPLALRRQFSGPAAGDKRAPAGHDGTINVVDAGIGSRGNDLARGRVEDVQPLFTVRRGLTPFNPQAMLSV
ncbi:hypothetical protein EAG21025_19920 [Enterobacter asburiae]